MAVAATVGDEELALAANADRGRRTIHAHRGVEAAVEIEAVADHGDLNCYPIDRPGSQAHEELVKSGWAKLQADGILLLDYFLSTNGIRVLQEEADLIEGQAYLGENLHAVYFSDPDESTSPSHPLRRTVSTRKRSIARHLMDERSTMNALCEWPAIRLFIGDMFGIET